MVGKGIGIMAGIPGGLSGFSKNIGAPVLDFVDFGIFLAATFGLSLGRGRKSRNGGR